MPPFVAAMVCPPRHANKLLFREIYVYIEVAKVTVSYRIWISWELMTGFAHIINIACNEIQLHIVGTQICIIDIFDVFFLLLKVAFHWCLKHCYNTKFAINCSDCCVAFFVLRLHRFLDKMTPKHECKHINRHLQVLQTYKCCQLHLNMNVNILIDTYRCYKLTSDVNYT